MLLGKLLASAALKEDKRVTWLPAYGAEVRGGTAHCMVVISDMDIASPLIEEADTLIAMNAPSLTRFTPLLKKEGLLVLNQSLIADNIKISARQILKAPFTDIAAGLGNIRVANTVALGAYSTRRKDIREKSILEAMEDNAKCAGR